MKAATLLSGGMDSTTVLYKMAEMVGWDNCVAISMKYPSKHNAHELKSATAIAKDIGIEHRVINLESLFSSFSSALLLTGSDIPEGHYESASMSQTVVPARNLIFAGIAAGFCESHGIGELWLGIHSGDHAIYPDCRPDFFVRLVETVLHATDQKVRCVAPFLNQDKTGILDFGLRDDIKVPYELTRTCYKNQGKACGKCGACQERLEAFANHGIKDPIEYE